MIKFCFHNMPPSTVTFLGHGSVGVRGMVGGYGGHHAYGHGHSHGHGNFIGKEKKLLFL